MSIEISKEAIEIANEALNLYNKELDQVVPWKGLKEEITKLDTNVVACSHESADRIGNLKTELLNIIDEYDSATQTIYEWCGLSAGYLKTYINLFDANNESKRKLQKKFVTNVLEHGTKKIEKAQENLDQCIDCFNRTSGHLASLSSSEVNGNLKPTIDQALAKTKQTKDKLNEKMQKMKELKIEVIKSEPEEVLSDSVNELRQRTIASAEQLIANCNEYRKNHETV